MAHLDDQPSLTTTAKVVKLWSRMGLISPTSDILTVPSAASECVECLPTLRTHLVVRSCLGQSAVVGVARRPAALERFAGCQRRSRNDIASKPDLRTRPALEPKVRWQTPLYSSRSAMMPAPASSSASGHCLQEEQFLVPR